MLILSTFKITLDIRSHFNSFEIFAEVLKRKLRNTRLLFFNLSPLKPLFSYFSCYFFALFLVKRLIVIRRYEMKISRKIYKSSIFRSFKTREWIFDKFIFKCSLYIIKFLLNAFLVTPDFESSRNKM